MKKLRKLRLKSAPDIMTETEMKHVVGGYSTSGHCYDGQFLFTCITTFRDTNYGDGTYTSSGKVCAKSSSDAREQVISNLTGLGVGFNVTCY